jgi:hypothetical protein
VDRGPVEGEYRSDHAVGLVDDPGLDRTLVQDLPVDALGDARVVVEAGVARDDVDPQGVALGLADLASAEFTELVGVLADARGDLTHEGASLLGREVPPDVLVGGP